MAKIKKKLAEKILKKKDSNQKKVVNPFEVHINKQKYRILGQKVKNDRGLPGVSRAKAIKKRKQTLLPEYNVKNKSNKFLDRRIGEKNVSMSQEDRTMARFAAERIKHHNKKSIYNLAEDEILTHRGQTLSEIDKFDDPRSDNEDSDNELGLNSSGKLNDDFVSDAHFGGGVLSKTGKEGAKSHKELIDQLIAESKKRKAEKQKTKEQTLELTEKLDSEWKDLLPLVNKIKKTGDEAADARSKSDDYDKVMRELKFEARGQPTDRLKSEDELAKEEKEKLEKLEQDRLNRMRGFVDTPEDKNKHKSADDLDDNFEYDIGPKITVAYDNEGNLLTNSETNKDDETHNLNNENNSESGSDNDNDDGDEDNDDDDDEQETEDDLSDLKESESDSDIEETIEDKSDSSKNIINKTKESPNVVNTNSNLNTLTEKKRKLENGVEKSNVAKVQKLDKITQKNEIMEKAEKELPYTFKIPDSYENLQELLTNQPPEYQNVIVERILKCNHPSLAAENKDKLNNLFVYLLQHLNDAVPETSDTSLDSMKQCFKILDSLTPHFYTLTQMNPENAKNSLIEIIKEKQNDYKTQRKRFPGVDVLLFLKLISCLFSTSDFRHQVVTPSLIFINQMLTNCRINSRYDIAYGLFLVTLFLEYSTLSKRFMPASIIYLTGLIHMAIPKLTVKLIKVFPPFKTNSAALVLVEKYNANLTDIKMHAEDLIRAGEINEEFKLRTFYTTLKLAAEFHENWNHLPSQVNIFERFFELLDMIPVDNYTQSVRDEIERFKTMFEDNRKTKKLEYIVYEKKKPKALRLYEPTFEKIYDVKRHKPMSKEKAEREKLLHKYKKEMKGALREIRRDKSFLSRVKINQRIQSDVERKEKVKQIYAEASIQQSELNSLDRKKKRK